MNRKAWKAALPAAFTVLLLAGSAPSHAQVAGPTLSGTVSDSSGKPAAGATVSAKNLASGETRETKTDSAGLYTLPNLRPGDYEVSVSAEGFSTGTSKVTIFEDAPQTLNFLNFTLGAMLSVGDLGFTSAEAQGDPKEQARLDKRSRMLRIHQRIGLIATAPIVASVVTGVFAGGKRTSTTDRWTHLVLGSAAGDLYGISAYYAIRAPKIAGTETRGPIKWHKILAWIHGPGMIMTPILGAIAFDQKSKGEHVHGIAQAHAPVAIVTAAAYGAAILSVSLKW